MRHSRTTFAAGIAVVGLILSACGSASMASPSEAPLPDYEPGTSMARIAAAGRIRVGINYNQPGFGVRSIDGKYSGFDVEVAKIIAGALGLTADNITWVDSPPNAREDLIQNATVDLIAATYTINDTSKERVTFAGPYYIAGQQLMVKSDNGVIKSQVDLKANPYQKVCAVAGSSAATQIMPELADASQLLALTSNDQCLNALRTDQAQVVTSDSLVLQGFVTASDKAFKLVGEQFSYGIGIKKGDVKFCDFINVALKNNAVEYTKAWADNAGTADGAPQATLPPAAACV
jgi:glutamate transport system substrate-binding protein